MARVRTSTRRIDTTDQVSIGGLKEIVDSTEIAPLREEDKRRQALKDEQDNARNKIYKLK